MSSGKTPWSPSKAAIARVKDPLPQPNECPYCGSGVSIVHHTKVYNGREFGDWPWLYRCDSDKCDSYVGMHPYTNIPLGTLANAATRVARRAAKEVFTRYWQSNNMTRTDGYAELARRMDINVSDCHFGHFEVEQCEHVIEMLK